jgi:hypothetical protein
MQVGGMTRERVLLGVVVAVALAAAGWLYYRSHENLPPAKAAAALRVRLHTTFGFRCRKERNDGTIALDGVDYFCQPVGRPEESGYWIATNAHRITGLLPSG